MRQTRSTERDQYAPSLQSFYGHGVYGREGRRLGVVRGARAGRQGGNQPYAIVELTSFSNNVSDLRAIPVSALAYDRERGHFLCKLSEVAVRSAPPCAGSADWPDGRWANHLDDYYDAVG